KQHHLYGVVVAYAVVVGFLIQLVSRAFPYFGWAAAVPAVIIVLLLGFPVVVVLAWTFIKPRDPAKYNIWQRRRWKLGATLSAVVVVAVVQSGLYAWRVSVRYEQRLAELAAMRAEVKPAVTPGAQSILAKSVAVLPFENLSTDNNNEYFVAGMQGLILTKLADIGDLKVISRTSTMQYQSRSQDLKTIGQQLGVATILEGGVQKAGNQILINVRLIDARSDNQIWAQSYQRTLDNVFGVEGEVAEKIAAALKAKLSPAETTRLATGLSADPAANDVFLRAEYFANQGQINYDTTSFSTAIPVYRRAIEKVPDFALARARLSYTESILAWFGGGGEDLKQLRTDARTQAQRALTLAPDLSAAHLALAYSDYYGKGDYAGALKAFDAAVTARPNDTDALAARGFVMRRQGRFDVASDSLQNALVLDPRNSSLAYELGANLHVGRPIPRGRTDVPARAGTGSGQRPGEGPILETHRLQQRGLDPCSDHGAAQEPSPANTARGFADLAAPLSRCT
ncbi:MAG: tetratricopeptide repeat protein, partial [Gammaproteobacteria bacterium]